MSVPELERRLGMEVYATKSPGIGGVIRSSPEDFIVREVLKGYGIADPPAIKHGAHSGEGGFLLAILEKEGWDTIRLLREIAQRLKVSERKLRVAGIKDAKAKTFQYITFENVPFPSLARVRLRGVSIHPISRIESPISSGSLSGNRFEVTIRNVSGEVKGVESRVREIMNEILEMGLPNYYGHQRFGTLRPVTHLVGRFIVKRDFEEAVLTYLTYVSEWHRGEVDRIRLDLRLSRDYEKALNRFPTKYVYERALLSHLISHPGDYIGALKRLPFTLRSLLVSAYQSYLFNLSLSMRARYGMRLNRVYTGDWVLNLRDGVYRSERVEEDEVEAVNAQIMKGESAPGIAVPGYLTDLKDTPQDKIIREVLSMEGVNLRDFYIGAIPEISAAGKIRPAVLTVSDFSYEVRPENGGTSIRMGFTLDKDCYATIVLREFMKPKDVISAGF